MKMLTLPLAALTMIAATSALAEDCGQDTRIILHDAFVGERACSRITALRQVRVEALCSR